jgi:hypothetical protein
MPAAGLQREAARKRGETGNDVDDRLVDGAHIQRCQCSLSILGVLG